MNQRYASSAIAPDGTPEPAWARDKELYYQATTWPGARLPHVWFDRHGEKVSSLDVVGKNRFTVLTGIGGEGWVEAARIVAAQTGVEIAAFVVGPGRDLTDIYGAWPDAREIAEAGCLLVRPDQHVAFRYSNAAADATALLSDAMAHILGFKAAGPAAQGGKS
jgi:2,4-dichlorophenol 6-monooxygenase